MKVKIGYSVETEQVPAKIVEIIEGEMHILDAVMPMLRDCCSIIESDTSVLRYKLGLESIHNIRTKLALFDQTLADASMILDGLYNLETTPEPVQPPVPNVDRVDSLQQAVANMGNEQNVD